MKTLTCSYLTRHFRLGKPCGRIFSAALVWLLMTSFSAWAQEYGLYFKTNSVSTTPGGTATLTAYREYISGSSPIGDISYPDSFMVGLNLNPYSSSTHPLTTNDLNAIHLQYGAGVYKSGTGGWTTFIVTIPAHQTSVTFTMPISPTNVVGIDRSNLLSFGYTFEDDTKIQSIPFIVYDNNEVFSVSVSGSSTLITGSPVTIHFSRNNTANARTATFTVSTLSGSGGAINGLPSSITMGPGTNFVDCNGTAYNPSSGNVVLQVALNPGYYQIGSAATVTITPRVAPAITTQPSSQTVTAGTTVTFSAAASGMPTPSYQWYHNSTLIGSATSLTLTLPSVTDADAGSYYIVAYNSSGNATSSTATLTVQDMVSIVTQPANQTAVVGGTATFTVAATGTGPLHYHWYQGASPIGTDSSVLTLSSVTLSEAGAYAVSISGALNTAYSSTATLTVIQTPSITSQPANATVNAGSTATFSVVASGTAPLSYQWYHGTLAVGGNSSALTLTSVADADSGSYTLVVGNAGGNVTSAAAYLTVIDAPTITSSPTNLTAASGGTATFIVTASGSSPLTYQWYFDATPVGSNSSALLLTNLTPANAGSYAVVISNSAGSVTSTAAILTVSSALPNLIDVDFAGNNGNTSSSLKVGFAAIGDTTNDFWNFYNGPDAFSGAVAPLIYVDGTTSSSAGVLISNAPGQWGNGTSDAMYAGYVYPWDNGNITVTITNLEAGLYNFYLYGHGNNDNQNSQFDVSVDSQDFGSALTTSGSDWTSSSWVEGDQYVVIRSVVVTNTNQVVTVTVSPNASSYAILSGMQIERLTNSVINVDFAGENGYSASQKTGFAATGESTNDSWNLYEGPYSNFGAISNLAYADGTVSEAGLTVDNAAGQWGNGTSDPMYVGYIYPGGGGDITVTVTNLPAGTYDVYLYGHGDQDDQDSAFDVAAGGTDYGSATTTATSAWNSVDWQEGVQYVVLRNVILGAGDTMIVTVAPNSSSYAVLAGMQLVRQQ